VESDEALTVYENASWVPGRARLGVEAAAASKAATAAALPGASFSGSEPVLDRRSSVVRFGGDVPLGSEVHLAQASSSRWELTVDGRRQSRRDGFGWANGWTVETSGQGRLRYRTSPLRWAAVLVELAIWVAVVRAWWRRRGAVDGDRR
jgi:hypothetical protein